MSYPHAIEKSNLGQCDPAHVWNLRDAGILLLQGNHTPITGGNMTTIAERLEELRTEIREERISYGEIAELQSLADHISLDDTDLLEWAGVPEFHWDDSDQDPEGTLCSETKCLPCREAEAGAR